MENQYDYFEKLIELKYLIYKRYLKTIPLKDLKSEYNDRYNPIFGDEIKTTTVGQMIDQLLDWYSNALYDDPNYTPYNINKIYFKEE